MTLRIGSTRDARIAALGPIGGGEGFATYTGTFEGRPAFLVDCGTMNDLLDEEDISDNNVTVHVFESEAARDQYVNALRRRSPVALVASDKEDG